MVRRKFSAQFKQQVVQECLETGTHAIVWPLRLLHLNLCYFVFSRLCGLRKSNSDLIRDLIFGRSRSICSLSNHSLADTAYPLLNYLGYKRYKGLPKTSFIREGLRHNNSQWSGPGEWDSVTKFLDQIQVRRMSAFGE
jgi:hypothetical protein